MADINTVKNWFRTGLKPTQAQFWAFFESIWFKNDEIPVENIQGLQEIIEQKADAEALTNHYNDVNAHGALLTAKEDKNKKGTAGGYAPLNQFAKIASEYLNIVNDLVTGGATDMLSAEQGVVLQSQIDGINLLLTSNDINLDSVQEIVNAIKTVQTSLSSILVNDLTTGGTTKALTAEMGKTLKGLIDTKTSSLVISGTYLEIKNLKDNNLLIPNNNYIITDYQSKYFIENSNSSPIKNIKKISSVISGIYAVLDDGYDYLLLVGMTVTITKLPQGYNGNLTIGQSTTVSLQFSQFYFQFANNMHTIMGLEFSYVLTRYTSISDNSVVNDVNLKPILKPLGVINTDVHDGNPYMDATAADNQAPPTESIQLIAATNSSFLRQGFSKTVEYDFDDVDIINDNKEIIGTRKGFVERRFNSVLNIDLNVDWRAQRYRRWLLSPDSISKFLNRDLNPTTTSVGFQDKHLFTSQNRSTTDINAFYIVATPEGKLKKLDENSILLDFNYSVLNINRAKDYQIFKLSETYQPVMVNACVVKYLNNTVFQGLVGEFDFKLTVNSENTKFINNTFVSNCVLKLYDSIIENSIFLDNFSSTISFSTIFQLKALSYLGIDNFIASNVKNLSFGTQQKNGNLTGNSGTTGRIPGTRWNYFSLIKNSNIFNSNIGSTLANFKLECITIVNSSIFVYYGADDEYNRKIFTIRNSVISNFVLMIPRYVDRVVFEDINTPDSNINSSNGLFFYRLNTGVTFALINVSFNKTNRKLIYQILDANNIEANEIFSDATELT